MFPARVLFVDGRPDRLQRLRLEGQPDSASRRLQFGTQAPEYELRVATPGGEARLTGKANGTVQLAMPGANRS